MTETLETKSLTLNYGDSNIIENLDLSIPMNEITVLIGANGCGKSTLLRSIARLLKPNHGSVLLDGQDIFKLSTKQVAKKTFYSSSVASSTRGVNSTTTC